MIILLILTFQLNCRGWLAIRKKEYFADRLWDADLENLSCLKYVTHRAMKDDFKWSMY